MHNCSFSRLITKYDNVSLQFTTARPITIYENVLLQCTIAWLLQFSATVIINDKYYNLRHYYSSRQNTMTFPNESLTEKIYFSTAWHSKDTLIHLYGSFTTRFGLEHDSESLATWHFLKYV